MAFFSHLLLLMWKNLLLQKKKICVSVFEVILPVLFGVIFMVIRGQASVYRYGANTFGSGFDINDQQTIYDDGGYYRKPKVDIAFVPNNTLVRGLMEKIRRQIMNTSTAYNDKKVNLVGFETQADMLFYLKYMPNNVSNAIVFNKMSMSDTAFPLKLDVTIRPGVTNEYGYQTWHTTDTFPFFQIGPRYGYRDPPYREQGFLYLQRLIYSEVTKHWNPSSSDILDKMKIHIRQMPYPSYISDPLLQLLQILFPILVVISFILMTIQTTKGIVYEKEKKLKESMKLMGLNSAAHWVSWFLTVFIYVLIIMALYTTFCGIDSGNGAVLATSDPSIFFVFLVIYGISLIAFCFMISVFTQRANIGAAVAGICFFISYCPYFYLQLIYQNMSRSAKLSSCLLMNMGMAFGINVITQYEATGSGVQWSNFHEPATVDDNFSLLDAMLMLLGDTAIYLCITWYIDNVFPGEFGVPKAWYFPFTRVYWCGSKQKHFHIADNVQENDHFEREPSGMKAGICIQKLTKTFGSGAKKKVAVDGMSLNMYEGQISVLLGHNGAGKTTTMSVLTGFIPASGGTALVNGYDINKDILSVRQSLGLCPQHNILFGSLTVQEHLEFFAKLKGVPRSQVQSEVQRFIREVGLEQKKFTQAQKLSGGQKRKLSVAIALIGGSKIVILDEPTSGMDPAARRQTWDILQRNKQGRTLLLTTHFMDEADLLGDRIAIMAEGVVKCCGTSYFLKKLYGAGYHLVLVKQPNCNVSLVTEAVTQHISTAILESEINAELSYLLPEDQAPQFAALFQHIEEGKEKLGISSFGTTATTMEEVFLKVEKTEEETGTVNGGFDHASVNPIMDQGSTSSRSYTLKTAVAMENGDDILSFNQGYKKMTGLMLQLSRFKGMFVKKALHTWRNRVITIVQLILPVIFAIAALSISKIDTSNRQDEVALTLDLSHFHGTKVPYSDGFPSSAETTEYANAYAAQFDTTEDEPQKIDDKNLTKYFLNQAEELGTGRYNKKMIISAIYNTDNLLLYFNGYSFHGIPTSLVYGMNAFVKYFTSKDHAISTTIYPLPYNAKESTNVSTGIGYVLGFSIAFCLIFGMAFLTSSFVFFLIKERLVGAKHLQVVSGVGPFVFWMSNLAWDFINYMIPVFLLMIVFGSFRTPAYYEDGRLGIVFLVLFMYGLAILPYMYTLQHAFTSPPTGMVLLIILSIVTGLATLMTNFMLTAAGKLEDARITNWIFCILFPHYNLGKSILNMFSNHFNMAICIAQNSTSLCARGIPNPCCRDSCGDYCLYFVENYLDFDEPGIGRYILIMILQSLFFTGITLSIEYHVPQRIWYCLRPTETDLSDIVTRQFVAVDTDVEQEKIRVAQMQIGHGDSDALVLKEVYKRFGDFVAVDHLSVGIPEKECFGLLGQNGAGKTTTFKMLTGDVMLTSGNAHLWSYDVKTSMQKVQENMGYCPQFDALIDQMTGRETLAMYARLRGVPEGNIKVVCERLLDIMMLKQYADKPTSEYSGGNKRKLSTAISLVGDPAFIMLDEPSTGMDPKARRQLWNVLSKVRECGRTLILTSHSMEECDALCTRIAIMVNGHFVCLGAPQHLKNKFGQGYTLITRMGTVETELGSTPADPQPLIQHICNIFSNTQVFDDHQGYVHFQVPYAYVTLSKVFSVMEQAKSEFCVEDYSVHQTTLEQVFLSFARAQIPPKVDKTSFCKRVCCCCG